MVPSIVLACWRRDQGPKLNLVICFLFYFLRQFYSVIYDMNCGCVVMSAASVQRIPNALAFPGNRNIASAFVYRCPRIILVARGTI